MPATQRSVINRANAECQSKRFWTPERLAELRRLAGEGLFAEAIGTALGCSKDAVIGKAYRENIALDGYRHFLEGTREKRGGRTIRENRRAIVQRNRLEYLDRKIEQLCEERRERIKRATARINRDQAELERERNALLESVAIRVPRETEPEDVVI